MKRLLLYGSILILPFLMMIVVNELVRPHLTEPGYRVAGIETMNPLEPKPDRCTWICHNNTTYCKEHHVQLARPYFDQIDPIYFGMINLLKATGNYGLANIVVFVVVLPLLMFLLLVRSIELELRIRNLKKS